ncbi:DUF5906 domain-containing protein [Marinobacterium sediminicola]|uniref:Primase C terminal 1 (PriCT-1) n=1 Tax=Marinobacterium sediminicola TaxID=518898 RepID=A0ABY1RXZ3_9GAMM|nr:DUF5906 domain-containing protein [Marinobacterium sediminicola]ULG68556.1 DUF5906 domain-containing protein [Marinobacterium sediminicola]SMR73069.1 Primase C terminal 1 (PriCT-1) [Marinobacterium sediminicola]
MTINVQPEQTAWLLDQLATESGSTHCFTTLPVQKGQPKEFNGTYQELKDSLVTNNTHSGVYFAVNQVQGKRCAANVTAVRALFLDLDGAPLSPVQAIAMSGGPAPNVIIESSPDRYHCYWLVSDCSLDQFSTVQTALAYRFEGDTSVCDLPRLARAPGFIHQKMKDGRPTKPFMTRIIEINDDKPRYSLAELIEGLGLDLSDIGGQPNRQSNERFDIQRNLTDGERTQALTQLCGRLIKERQNDEVAMEMLVAWNQSRCNPPLPLEKLQSTYASVKRTDRRNNASAPAAIAKLNAEYAITTLGGKAVVLRERPERVDYLSASDFKLLHCDGSFEGKALGAAWLNHPLRRKFINGVTFDPGQKGHRDGHYNLYRGWGCQPTEGDCSLFLDHLRDVICSGNDAYYTYLLDWLADMFQNTARLPGVAIVMKGARGAGKSFTANTIGSLWARAHYKHISNPDHLVGRFNSHLQDCLLCFADEALFAADARVEQQLKVAITEPQRMIEAKGKDAIMVNNYTRVMMATNSEWSVPAGADERRYFVLQVSDEMAQKHDYFRAIAEQLDTGGREALLHFLLNREIRSNIRQSPKTEALLEQKLYSLPSVSAWWYDCLLRGAIGPCTSSGVLMEPVLGGNDVWPTFAPTDALYEHYLQFATQQRERYPAKKPIMMKTLKRLAGVSPSRPATDAGRKRGYQLPDLEICREVFTNSLQQPINWEDAA